MAALGIISETFVAS